MGAKIWYSAKCKYSYENIALLTIGLFTIIINIGIDHFKSSNKRKLEAYSLLLIWENTKTVDYFYGCAVRLLEEPFVTAIDLIPHMI